MNFDLTDQQQDIQRLARDFARKEIQPHAEHFDETGDFPTDIINKAFDAGLMYPNVPTEYGGAGLSLVEECLYIEELAWACAGITGALTISAIPAIAIIIAANDDQKKRFLGGALENKLVTSYALTEPGAGSDVRRIRTAAKRVGDEFSISGSKCFITGATNAGQLVVFAVTDPDAGHRGISVFCIPADREGIKIGPAEKKMGQSAAHIGSIYLEDVKASADELIGGEGAGFKMAMEVFNRSRPTIAGKAIGIARRAKDEAARYANERQSMGVPIIQHEGIGFMLADMDVAITAARHLTLEAAWKKDNDMDNRVEAARCKVFAADAAMKITTDAVQVFGGYGYMREYPVEKLMRDAKVTQIYEGTTQIQRLIIARSMMESR